MQLGTVAVDWHGITVDAAVPAQLAGWAPELAATTARRTERAAAAAVRASDRAVGNLEAAARMLLRAEGLASSAIEGLRAPVAAVAVAEAAAAEGAGRVGDDVAAWVADNLAIVAEALAATGPLGSDLLLSWHRRLMRNSPTIESRHVGRYRDTLGWVGGANPKVAAHVAAPADLIDAAMVDLFEFAARDDIDPITQAAVVHAQFETIHPFADGNGRLGRVLVGWVLAHRLGVSVPPPVSLQMARDVGGYQSGLTMFRQGFIDHWVTWFADAVADAADNSAAVLAAVAELQDRWRGLLAGVRADAAAHALIDELPAHPVLSATSAAALAGVSRPAGATALAQLSARGILVEVDEAPRARGRPRRWWIAEDLLALLGR